MKILLSICMIVMSSYVVAGEMPAGSSPGAGVVTGVVQEVQDVANFTYLRIKTSDGEIWAAVINTPVRQGASVIIDDAVVMKDFVSKGLNRTFPSIVFGTMRGAAGKGAGTTPSRSALGLSVFGATGLAMSGGQRAPGNAMGAAPPTMPVQKLEPIKSMHVDKASGANARTVAEVNKQAVGLRNKTVVVRGRVVKYNAGIMGKNWLHLQDGSGSAADESDDILVTTTAAARLGDVVTVKGIVRNDKDFGAGYVYRVLIEEATLQ